MGNFVDQIHLYKMPMYRATAMAWCSLAHVSQNTWRTHCHVHLGLVQLHLVLPHLQAMYYDKDSFLISWSSPLTTIELHALINNGHPTCINNASMVKSLTPVYISKDLSSSANLNTGGENNLLLSSPKAWWQSSSHSWDSHFATSWTRF